MERACATPWRSRLDSKHSQWNGHLSGSSCPGLSRASTYWLQLSKKDVDGRDKPGHDEKAEKGLAVQLPRPPRAVIFDMDGLLIDTIPAYVAVMVEAGLDVGHPVSRDYVLSLAGLLGAELEALLMADRTSAHRIEPIIVAAGNLAPITLDNVVLVPGPRASRDMHKRLDAMRALRPDSPST